MPASARAPNIRFLLCVRVTSAGEPDWISVVSVMAVSLLFWIEDDWRYCEQAETARPPVRDLLSENARQDAEAPLSAAATGSSSVRKAGRSVEATSISPASPLSAWRSMSGALSD